MDLTSPIANSSSILLKMVYEYFKSFLSGENHPFTNNVIVHGFLLSSSICFFFSFLHLSRDSCLGKTTSSFES